MTLEFSNTTPLPAKIYANEGVAQVIFLESDEVCETSYNDRGGKYQGQKGVTLPGSSSSAYGGWYRPLRFAPGRISLLRRSEISPKTLDSRGGSPIIREISPVNSRTRGGHHDKHEELLPRGRQPRLPDT